MGSLYFIPSFLGEYEISQFEPKKSCVFMTSCSKQERSLSQMQGISSMIDQNNTLLRLLRARLISLPPITWNKFYNKSSFCAYHQLHGHSTNEYKALSNKIQHLKDCGALPCVDAPTSSNW